MITRLIPLLLLTGCSTMPTPTCDRADQIRLAATLALRTLDRVCPIAP